MVKEIVRPADLVKDDPTLILANPTFVNKDIRGPAVLLLLGSIVLTGCSFSRPGSDLVIEIPADRQTIVGVVAMRDAVFDQCSFTAIGLAAFPEQAAKLHQVLV
jgi:hypothetical protein